MSPGGEDRLELRVARIVTAVATGWFALAASWELFGPILAGHYASMAGIGIMADNMLRWHIAGPVWEYTAQKPPPSAYYCHHPWGIFWTTAAFMKILGRHDFVCRLPAVLLSIATPPLLFGIGRRVWRPAAGAAAAMGFVVLPIALAFAHFNSLEVAVIAWSLLGLYGLVRMTETWQRRWLAVSIAGMTLALHADWAAFPLAGALLAFGLLRAFVSGSRLPRLGQRRYAQWWAALATSSVVTLVLYVALFQRAGKLDDLLGTYATRASGNQTRLSDVLASRRYWIELSFTPIAIALGKLAAIVSLVRCVWVRREHEVLPLAMLVMATVQYVVFRQGADIHIFWPHYFAAYFALGLGALVASLAAGIARGARWLAARRARSPGRLASAPASAFAALTPAALVCAAVARDGIPALRYGRETGGRFNEKGLVIHSDGAKTAFLRWLDARLPRSATVDLHEGMKPTWAQVWALGGRVVTGSRPPPRRPTKPGQPVFLADTRFMLSATQQELAEQFHVVAVGPFWAVDPAEGIGSIDAFRFVESEPSALEWYFVSGTEPHRVVEPDAFLTWELRVHFGQAAEPPAAEPHGLDQLRIAHNAALLSGDTGQAARLRAAVEAQLEPIGARFDDGSVLVGKRWTPGARSLLTLIVEAAGSSRDDVQLTCRSKVLAPAPLSTTMADPTDREVGLPIAIAPQRWIKGFLYAAPIGIRKRPGTEVFHASYWVRGKASPPKCTKHPACGPRGVEVLTLR